MLKDLFQKNKIYLIPFFIISLLLFLTLLFNNKIELHIWINKHWSPFSDIFFKYCTHLGDGLAPVVIGVVALFFSFRKSILILLGSSLAGLLAQFFKRVVFPGNMRPKPTIGGENLHLIEGVAMHDMFSFPSGHTTTVFALTFALCLITKKPLIKLLLFLVACLTAYSRVYLSQHFFEDILAGAYLGISFIFAFYIWTNKWKATWLDKSLLTLFK